MYYPTVPVLYTHDFPFLDNEASIDSVGFDVGAQVLPVNFGSASSLPNPATGIALSRSDGSYDPFMEQALTLGRLTADQYHYPGRALLWEDRAEIFPVAGGSSVGGAATELTTTAYPQWEIGASSSSCPGVYNPYSIFESPTARLSSVDYLHPLSLREVDEWQPPPAILSTSSSSSSSSPPRKKRIRKPLPRKFICATCTKAFDRASNLSVHMVTHSDTKAFACAHCQATFTLEWNYKRHLNKCKRCKVKQHDSVVANLPLTLPSHVSTLPHFTHLAITPMFSFTIGFKSLGNFTLFIPSSVTVFVPLPAVYPHSRARALITEEERDSAAHCDEFPYHPARWNGRLPGPAQVAPQHPSPGLQS